MATIIQQQHNLLSQLSKAYVQWKSTLQDADIRLQNELSQIEDDCKRSLQAAEQQYDEAIETTVAAFKSIPVFGNKEAEKRWNRKLLDDVMTTVVPPANDVTSVWAARGAIAQVPRRTRIYQLTFGAFSLIFIIILFVTACALAEIIKNFMVFIVSIILISIPLILIGSAWQSSNKQALLRIKSVYKRWQQLINEEAKRQQAQAQERYTQTVKEARNQVLATVERLRPAIAELDAQAVQISPGWELDIWQEWEPGRFNPGAVRLGTFKKMEV